MRLAVAVGVLLLAGCGRGGDGRTPARPVFTDAALTASGPSPLKKALGEDCVSGRQASCASQLCLKAAPGLSTGFFCSRACEDERECPSDWTCQAAMPGPHGRLCIPPENWTARPVGVRP